jgi:thiopurine S-methyltransferase
MFDFAPPPFGGTKAEYATLFSPYFTFKHFDACYNSVKPRSGNELFITFVRK